MFIFSFKLTKEKIVTAMCVCLALFGLGIFFFNKSTQSVSVDLAETRAGTVQERQNYLNSLGWHVDPQPIAQTELSIPAEFDSVYEEYGNMLKKSGYDLGKYKGKSVTKYTYTVKNYPDAEGQVVINLLVSDDKVIGGDIGGVAPGSFLKELNFNNAVPRPQSSPSSAA